MARGVRNVAKALENSYVEVTRLNRGQLAQTSPGLRLLERLDFAKDVTADLKFFCTLVPLALTIPWVWSIRPMFLPIVADGFSALLVGIVMHLWQPLWGILCRTVHMMVWIVMALILRWVHCLSKLVDVDSNPRFEDRRMYSRFRKIHHRWMERYFPQLRGERSEDPPKPIPATHMTIPSAKPKGMSKGELAHATSNLRKMADDMVQFYEMESAKLELEGLNIETSNSNDPTLGNPLPLPLQEEEEFPTPTSWRNPRSSWYAGTSKFCRHATLRRFLSNGLVLITLVLLLLPIHVIALPNVNPGFRRVMSAAGEVTFMSAENMARAKEELEKLKAQPHDSGRLAQQFSHDINSHLPDGIQSSADPSRYEKDDDSKLVMDRVPGVTDDQFNSMRSMLRGLAPDVVAYTLDDITGYNGTEPPMEIPLDTTAPIFCPPRRNWSPAELEVIDQKCTELLDTKICMKLSTSNYACNPVLAIKRAPDGTWSDKRFCVNFIPINRHTELDRYGSHRADELFQRVVTAKFLTALDLRSGFHQIPMAPDSIAKTAFWYVTQGKQQPPQLLAYTRMPFGLKNAPAKFQRVVDAKLLRSKCTEFAFAYIDDLLIASDTYEEHVEHVRQTLTALKEANLMIHPDKSVFGTNIIEYLGHNVVGTHGITMNEAKVAAIKTLPAPTNLGELRSILGFLAYYRHFIPGFSSIVAPMNNLLKKGVPWNWGEAQQAAYTNLKQLMTEPGKVLRPIDPNRQLILHTDWSVHGIGAVLGQLDDDGHEYLCACISRSLNKHERNYPSYKGELLALAWAVRMFCHHLFGTEFQLVTDHQPLLWIMKAKDLNGQYARWQLMLQEYDFNIVHRAGIKHTNADVLSRFPQASDRDTSGARLDGNLARIVAVMTARSPLRCELAIDDFAPRFRDLFHHGVNFVSEHTYMDPLMKGEGPFHDNSSEVAEQVALDKHVATIVATMAAEPTFPTHVEKALGKAQESNSWGETYGYGAGIPSHAFDTSVVGPKFFPEAQAKGVVLVELCGGIGAMLQALLKAGIKVQRYFYVDKDPVARRLVSHRLPELARQYPTLFTPASYAEAFKLPQDIREVTRDSLRETLGWDDTPHLVAAGWPCQEYSPAGHGRVGERAALLDDVLRVIRYIQEQPHSCPMAYVLENVAMQLNFCHGNVRYPVYDELCSRIGSPITFDAVQVGSRAHRLRNYWTNLVEAPRANTVYCNIAMLVKTPLTDILGPGRHPTMVASNEGAPGWTHVNMVAEPRKVFPTFTAFVLSRAFRPSKPGSLFDDVHGWTEPNAAEREAAMGYTSGATDAPGLTNVQRCQLLGQAMDLRSLVSLWIVGNVMCKRHVAAGEDALHPLAKDAAATASLPYAPVNFVRHMTSLQAFPAVAPTDDLGDIWEDQATMAYLQNGILPSNPAELNRVRKRQRMYRWQAGNLHRYVVDRRNSQLTLRLVPHPSKREAAILTIHSDLGHLGEKCTIDALCQLYWWHGLTVDVKRMLSTCKLCKRVNNSPRHRMVEMQTASHHTYGMFYRWGLDYAGELPPSASGNKYALIAIDYYTKWIKVIPVPEADAATTVRNVLLHLIARYGVPAKLITDNGSAFKGEFEAFFRDRFIEHRPITPDVPRSNGLAERAVQTVKNALKKFVAKDKRARNWDTEGLASILLGYRCTVQAATGLSPAQILFAQDPAVNADVWISREPPLDFEDADLCADELIRRADIAKDLCIQVVENLRLAHDRNAARYKALRSGLYKPKIQHFTVGDYVFTRHPKDKVPGGALGIINRDEILKVVEVRSSGVLLLENQVGARFTKHMETCTPCGLSNVEGTVHPDIVKPAWNFPCSVCGDHRHGSKMLLCDGCNLGFHTYCLPVPLPDVPDDDVWLCPTCVGAGITTAKIEARRERYIPVERSRPAIELPGRARRAKAQQLAEQWHGAVVRHETKYHTRIGRMTFTDVSEAKWFKVYWQDGTTSLHDSRFLARLGILPESEAPDELLPKPDPVVVLSATTPSWSLLTVDDVRKRLNVAMPGEFNPYKLDDIHEAIKSRRRFDVLTRCVNRDVPAHQLRMLQAVINFGRCRVILDPFSGCSAVRKGLRVPAHCLLVLNDRLGHKTSHLQYEPLESVLYTRVTSTVGEIDAIVMCPPLLLADLALVTALEFACHVVCMLVSDDWLVAASNGLCRPRGALLSKLESESRLVYIREEVADNLYFNWICIFASLGSRNMLINPHMAHSLVENHVLVFTDGSLL